MSKKPSTSNSPHSEKKTEGSQPRLMIYALRFCIIVAVATGLIYLVALARSKSTSAPLVMGKWDIVDLREPIEKQAPLRVSISADGSFDNHDGHTLQFVPSGKEIVVRSWVQSGASIGLLRMLNNSILRLSPPMDEFTLEVVQSEETNEMTLAFPGSAPHVRMTRVVDK